MKIRTMRQLPLILPIFLAVAVGPSWGEKADRGKAVDLEADKVSVDDAKKTLVFEGNVILTQGTLNIRASRLVVVQDQAGFQKGTAYGSPARFRQKRDGRDDYIEGEAERIEHDAHHGRTEFFVKARVKSGGDDVAGNYITFDALTERYSVSGAPAGTPGATPADTRVRATLQPQKEPAKE